MAMQTNSYKTTKPDKARLRMLGLLIVMLGLAVVAGIGFTNFIEPIQAQSKTVEVAAASTNIPAATTTVPAINKPSNTGNSKPATGQNPGQAQRSGRGVGGGRGGNITPAMLLAAANTLGISATELNSELASNKTFAQIAEAHNVDIQTLKDAMLADIKAQIDNQVKNGGLSQQQADMLYQRNSNALDNILNHSFNSNNPSQTFR